MVGAERRGMFSGPIQTAGSGLLGASSAHRVMVISPLETSLPPTPRRERWDGVLVVLSIIRGRREQRVCCWGTEGSRPLGAAATGLPLPGARSWIPSGVIWFLRPTPGQAPLGRSCGHGSAAEPPVPLVTQGDHLSGYSGNLQTQAPAGKAPHPPTSLLGASLCSFPERRSVKTGVRRTVRKANRFTWLVDK